jgi:hypothetical protein
MRNTWRRDTASHERQHATAATRVRSPTAIRANFLRPVAQPATLLPTAPHAPTAGLVWLLPTGA